MQEVTLEKEKNTKNVLVTVPFVTSHTCFYCQDCRVLFPVFEFFNGIISILKTYLLFSPQDGNIKEEKNVGSSCNRSSGRIPLEQPVTELSRS